MAPTTLSLLTSVYRLADGQKCLVHERGNQLSENSIRDATTMNYKSGVILIHITVNSTLPDTPSRRKGHIPEIIQIWILMVIDEAHKPVYVGALNEWQILELRVLKV